MSNAYSAWGNGLLGVIIFSGSLPATRVAVAGFEPMFLTSARAVLAALLGAAMLALYRIRRPTRPELAQLGLVSLGVVLGFPLLTALALQHITAARSIVFIGLLPLATAGFGLLLGERNPRWPFWLLALAGSTIVSGYALAGSQAGTRTGDLLMLAAVALCGLGYAQGARLTRTLGGWQVISWALVVAMPLMLVLGVLYLPSQLPHTLAPWLGLAYVAIFSMLVGFVFWYRALAIGGTSAIGQLQLLQPFFGLALSGLLLGERIDAGMIAAAAGVVATVAAARRYA